MIKWSYYPKSDKATSLAKGIVAAFESVAPEIDSETHNLNSNKVLALAGPRLAQLGFAVGTGKKSDDKILVPVLFGLNGELEKSFNADAYHETECFVLEVEAGRREQPIPEGFVSGLHDARRVILGDCRSERVSHEP